jgi:SSS family transporter
MNKIAIGMADYLMILLYIIGIFIVAFKSGKKTHKHTHQISKANLANEQYLAGRDISFTESICSIIATEVSALTFLGIPAFAFDLDYSFIHVYFGAIVARLLIAFVYLPKIYGHGLTLYEIMAHRGGTKMGQRLTSLFFTITKIFSVGVRLFSGSIIISTFFDVNIYLAIAIICALTFFYTLIGGLKAVVRTDVLQMFIFIAGGFFAHYYIPGIAQKPWGELMDIAIAAGKTNFFEWSNPMPFIIGFFGGIIFDSATHGVDQDFLQRLMANRTLKKAQWAISLSAFLSIFVGFLFLSIGSLIWAHYQSAPMPEGVGSDQIFAYFITHYFPTGIKGIMVAGVLAATMSTLDSTINALSSCIYNDIVGHRDPNKIERYYQFDTLLITLLLMIVSFVASKSTGLLMMGLKIQSWTAGALLSLFFMTTLFKGKYKVPLQAWTVIMGYAMGVLGVYLNTYYFQWSWHFNTYLGFGFATITVVTMHLIQKHKGTY